jgi:uncharacterized membrane protein YphA (DoxX/SURF4 family)
MNVALWIVQVLLAIACLGAGLTKLTSSPEEMIARGMAYVADTPLWMSRLAGIAEVVGAAGLVLPSATRILPRLAGYAAAGLLAVMVLALLLHITRGDLAAVVPPLVFGGCSAFVAYGRLVVAPIEPRR